MITEREHQGKPVTFQATQASAQRLRQFLEDALGDTSWYAASHAWVDAVPTTRDPQFVEDLRRAFRGVPLGRSDTVHVSFNANEPRLWKVACGRLTLVCVFAPRNGAVDDCAFLPLWSGLGSSMEPPPWLFVFDVAAVIRAIEDVIARRARWSGVTGGTN
jgi:hypothetical protein